MEGNADHYRLGKNGEKKTAVRKREPDPRRVSVSILGSRYANIMRYII